MYSHPIYSEEGGWPKMIEDRIAEKSLQEGYARSRLPRLTPEEILLVKGIDCYFSICYYLVHRIVNKQTIIYMNGDNHRLKLPKMLIVLRLQCYMLSLRLRYDKHFSYFSGNK